MGHTSNSWPESKKDKESSTDLKAPSDEGESKGHSRLADHREDNSTVQQPPGCPEPFIRGDAVRKGEDPQGYAEGELADPTEKHAFYVEWAKRKWQLRPKSPDRRKTPCPCAGPEGEVKKCGPDVPDADSGHGPAGSVRLFRAYAGPEMPYQQKTRDPL